MSHFWVLGSVASRIHAEQVVDRLRLKGVRGSEMFVVWPVITGTSHGRSDSGRVLCDIAKSGPLGCISGLDAVSTSEPLPIIAGGPILKLIGQGIPADLVAGLTRMGLDETSAHQWVNRLSDGAILIGAAADTSARMAQIARALKTTGAGPITTLAPEATPAVRPLESRLAQFA